MLNLQEKSLEWAIKSIMKSGDSYIFPNAFEFEAITHNWMAVKDYLKKLDVSGNGLRQYRTAVTPKSRFGFRISTQLDPLDSIIFNAIIYEIHELIESRRIPASDNVVYSFRLSPKDDGSLYHPDYNWSTFNKKAREIISSNTYEYVVVTDIADFFPSIYLHNIETYLRECVKDSGKRAHAEVFISAIKTMHSIQTHKGLPIGPEFSRPIAELLLNEVDKILIDNKIKFIRCVDDYRIFCMTESEAYKQLTFLAQKLYNLLNLKLNEAKTEIIKKDVLAEKYLRTFQERTEDKLIENFNEICSNAGIDTTSYDDVEIDSLDANLLETIKMLNLSDVLQKELENEFPNHGMVKFLIKNLARFDNTEIAELVLKEENIKKLFPILKTIIEYLHRVKSFSASQKHKIGETVIKLLKNSFIGELEFNRSWLISLFSKNNEWDNTHHFLEMLKEFTDISTQRELLLAIGRSKNIDYFREERLTGVLSMNVWIARAFLAAISCLPEDERRAFYKSRKGMHRDFLDSVVENWAETNHY